jgi:GNAT superfamily N-acetyltransferase
LDGIYRIEKHPLFGYANRMMGDHRTDADVVAPLTSGQGQEGLTAFRQVDWADEGMCRDWLRLLDAYACDPMGGGVPLAAEVRSRLVSTVRELSFFVAWMGYRGTEAVALANCMESFSTFACRKVLNIHDFCVLPEWRGRGFGLQLMQAVEVEARRRGCCKLTLEVLEGNRFARSMYESFGFVSYQLLESTGRALFLQKVF